MMILKNYTSSIFRNLKAYIALCQPNPDGLFSQGNTEQRTLSVLLWQRELQQVAHFLKSWQPLTN